MHSLEFFKGLYFQNTTEMRGRVSPTFWRAREHDDISREQRVFLGLTLIRQIIFSCFRQQGIFVLLKATLSQRTLSLGNKAENVKFSRDQVNVHTYLHTLFGVLYIVHRQCPNKFTIY